MNNPRIFFLSNKPLISSKRFQEQRINFRRAACIRGGEDKKLSDGRRRKDIARSRHTCLSFLAHFPWRVVVHHRVKFRFQGSTWWTRWHIRRRRSVLNWRRANQEAGWERKRKREEKKQGWIIKPNEWEQVDISIERNDGIDDN